MQQSMGIRGAVAAIAVAAVLGAVPVAQGGGFVIEGFGGIGTGPKTFRQDFDSKFGGGGGIGYRVTDHFQVLADVAAFKWEGDSTFTRTSAGFIFCLGNLCFSVPGSTTTVILTETVKNTPVFLGGRYYLLSGNIRPFLEAGVGINLLKYTAVENSGSPAEFKKTKIGAIPGAGVEFKLGKNAALGARGRYYWVGKGLDSDTEDVESAFFSGQAYVAFRF